ncbi:MAG: hypothetical protein E7262_07365 [Lachnospiraceae bacterium]|nr:hypothetical protein [Lachnospiraceae bacterium]
MDENSKLIPSNIKAQCNAAIAILEDNNRCLWNAFANIESFELDSSIESIAFDAIKTQIANFYCGINYLRTANDLDIQDYKELIEIVGDEELDGKKLFEQLEIAKKELKASEEALANYNKLSKTLKTDSSAYTETKELIGMYEDTHEINAKTIAEIQKKIDLYDEIDAKSSKLFENGNAIRKAGMTAIEETMKSSYAPGKYTYVSNTDVATKTMGMLSSSNLLAYNSVDQREVETVEYIKNDYSVTDSIKYSIKKGKIAAVQGFTYSALRRNDLENNSELHIAYVNSKASAGLQIKDGGKVDPKVCLDEEVEMDMVRYVSPELSHEGKIAGQDVKVSCTNTTSLGVLELDLKVGVDKEGEGIELDAKPEAAISVIKNTTNYNVDVGDYNLKGKIDLKAGYVLEKPEIDFTEKGLEIDTPYADISLKITKD